jgi:carbonic anhydrase
MVERKMVGALHHQSCQQHHPTNLYMREEPTMNALDTLVQRNHEFATQRFVAGRPMFPSLDTMIIGGVDPRVDPAHVLGLQPADAVVIRHVGERITPGTLQTKGMLGRITQAEGTSFANEFHLIVLQHTHCGIAHLEGTPEMLAGYFGISPEELPAKAVTDPPAAVAADVALLKSVPALPSNWLVSGLVYDVIAGQVEVVVPPAPLHPSAHSASSAQVRHVIT